MYMYHEGIAKKSRNEVCTFLQDYIEKNVSPEVKELYLFSDNCSGQNKNHTVLRFLAALCDSGRFDKIIYFLPVRGHSFLPCDRDFGTIKRTVRRADRVFLPKDFTNMVQKCSNNKNKFEVKEIETDDIKDFKSWWISKWKKNTNSTETATSKKNQKQSFTISKFSQFEFSSQKKGTITPRFYIDGLEAHTFRLGLTKNPVPLPKEKAYKEKVSINNKKLKDIENVIKYVDDDFKPFYQHILTWPTKDEEGDSEGGDA